MSRLDQHSVAQHWVGSYPAWTQAQLDNLFCPLLCFQGSYSSTRFGISVSPWPWTLPYSCLSSESLTLNVSAGSLCLTWWSAPSITQPAFPETLLAVHLSPGSSWCLDHAWRCIFHRPLRASFLLRPLCHSACKRVSSIRATWRTPPMSLALPDDCWAQTEKRKLKKSGPEEELGRWGCWREGKYANFANFIICS